MIEIPTPDPFVSSDVDLKGFPGFVLDVEALLASELVALATADEIAAALMLWCRAWQQKPHGSLPNDERTLAAFSKAKNWKKVRDMALRGFVLCTDGRLYHKTLCVKVNDAWAQRLTYQAKRQKDAERLSNWRDRKRERNDDGNADETRFKASTKHLRSEVKRSEVEENHSVPTGTGAEAPGSGLRKTPEQMTKDDLWAVGKSILVEAGTPAKQCGAIVGKLCKDHGDDIVVEAVRIAVVQRPVDPIAFLKATCLILIGERKRKTPWWTSDELILAEGTKHKLTPHPGESMSQFKARVQAAIDSLERPVKAASSPAPTLPRLPTPAPNEEKRDMSPEAVAMRRGALQAALGKNNELVD